MRAVRVKKFGGPEVLDIDEVPIPSPKADEVPFSSSLSPLPSFFALFVSLYPFIVTCCHFDCKIGRLENLSPFLSVLSCLEFLLSFRSRSVCLARYVTILLFLQVIPHKFVFRSSFGSSRSPSTLTRPTCATESIRTPYTSFS